MARGLSIRAGAALICMLLTFANTNGSIYPAIAQVFPLAREIATFFGIAFMALLVLVINRAPRLLRAGWLSVTALVAVAAYVLCCEAGLARGSASLLTVGAVLDSLAEAWLFILAYTAFARIPTDRQAPVAAASCVFAAVVGPALQGIDARMALALSALLLVCIFLCARPFVAEPFAAIADAGPQSELAVTNPFSFLPANHLLYVTILCFSFAQGLAATLSGSASLRLASVVAAIPLVAILALFLLTKRTGSADVLFGVSAVFVLAGLFLIPTSHEQGGAFLFGAKACLEAGDACFNLLLILLVGNIASRNMLSVASVAAWTIGLSWLGIMIGAPLGHAFNDLAGSEGGVIVWTSLVVSVAFAVYCFVALKRFSFEAVVRTIQSAAPPDPSAAEPATIRERSLRVAEAYGLTPRETEVLELLASGRTVGVICDKLTISLNTARYHTKNIYSKLGVHSQQNLIDIVEKQAGCSETH